MEERKKRRREVTMETRRNKLLKLGLLRLFRNSMNSMRIITMCGLIVMKLTIINNIMIMILPKKKFYLLFKRNIRRK